MPPPIAHHAPTDKPPPFIFNNSLLFKTFISWPPLKYNFFNSLNKFFFWNKMNFT